MPGKLLTSMQRDHLRQAQRRPRRVAPISAPRMVDLLQRGDVADESALAARIAREMPQAHRELDNPPRSFGWNEFSPDEDDSCDSNGRA